MSQPRMKQTLRGKELEGYRQAHYQAWKESGLTQREYCETKNLSLHTFKNWREALHKERRLCASSSSGFIPFVVEEKAPEAAVTPLQVTLPGNVAIVIKEGFNASLLRQVIEALRS